MDPGRERQVRVSESRISRKMLSAMSCSLACQRVGDQFAAGDVLGEVESTKSVSEIYAPVDGAVIEVNGGLVEAPEYVNADPYGQGWICLIDAVKHRPGGKAP